MIRLPRTIFKSHGLIPACLGMVLALENAHAGAWPMEPGTGVAALSVSFLKADQISDAEGHRHKLSMTEVGANGYAELGVFKNFAAGGSISPQKYVSADTVDVFGPSDLELWLTEHIGNKNAWQFAMRYLAVFPVGISNPSGTPDYAYALLSQGALGAELMPLVGIGRGRNWTQLGAGLRLRNHNGAAQFRYQWAMGHAFGANQGLNARFSLSGVVPLDSKSNGRPSDQELYFGDQLALDWNLPKMMKIGIQFDSMLTPGQELPLGVRFNAVFGWSWK